LKNKLKLLFLYISFTFIFLGPIFAANNQDTSDSQEITIPKGLEDIWDSDKYISLDEIQPGMEAYCLTEYSIAGIEKFAMDVIDNVYD